MLKARARRKWGKDEMVWVSTNGEEMTGKKIIQNIEKLKFNLN